MAYSSRSYPDRTGSTDSHLLPAGSRHVPRGSRDPPPRPWQSERQQPQRVRFEDSFDEQHDRPTGILRNGAQVYAHGLSRSPTRAQRSSHARISIPQRRRGSEDAWEDRRQRGRIYDDSRSGRYRRRRLDSSEDHRPSIRQESDDENQRSYTPYPAFGTESYRTRSPEPIVKSETYSDAGEIYARPEIDIRPLPTGSRTARSSSPSDSGTSTLSNSDLEYEDLATSIYEFNPSHWVGRDPLNGELTASMFSVSGETSGAKEGRGLDKEGQRSLQVYQSEYTGDGFPEGSHSAKLTAVLDGKRGRQPLFRWRHVTQASMNFDDLSDEVGRMGGISDSDKHGLVKLLSDVKKYSIKSTPTSKGTNVKHIDPGFLQVRLEPEGRSDAGNGSTTRQATWLCIPYFSLQKYAGLLSEARSGSYPTRTLLQEQYSGVPRERDMQQAICQTGHVPANMCFHVAQLWCIVVGDSLLITCGTMTEAAVRGDVIDLITEPSRNPTGKGSSPFIYVYYSDAVLYAIPLDECKSWFGFIAHFHEFWPQTLRFTHRDRVITAVEWPATLDWARNSNTRATLHLTVVPAPQPPPRGELNLAAVPDAEGKDQKDDAITQPKQSRSTPEEAAKTEESAPDSLKLRSNTGDDKFHVFGWLGSSITGARGGAHTSELQTQLQEVHDFLSNKSKPSDRTAYQTCPEGSRLDTANYLQQHRTWAEATKDRRRKQRLGDRIDIYNASELICRFFMPLDFGGPTVGKFWGAVHRLVQIPEQPKSRERDASYRKDKGDLLVQETRPRLRELTQIIQAFVSILSHAQNTELAAIPVPLQLIRAWVHLVLALVKADGESSNVGYYLGQGHLDFAIALIKEGMAEVMQALPSGDLLSNEVLLPMDVVSLLSLKLLQDSTGALPNIDKTYSEYLHAMDNEVATKPADRSFEHRANLLKQETSVILKIVGKQRRIFTSLTADTFRTNTLLDRTALHCDATSPWSTAPKKRAIDHDEYYAAQAASYVPHRAYSEAPPRHPVRAHEAYDPCAITIRDEFTKPPQEYYRISPTTPGGFRDLLVGDCLALTERRYTAFQEFFPYVEYLQKYNENKYSNTKDRQEQAIYAFTIVTVIFLPLSAVAGIFGMNTSDVRNMELGQWVYWAVAVPVTIAVIGIGLWWMGELGNVTWTGLGVGGRGRGAYYSMYSRRAEGYEELDGETVEVVTRRRPEREARVVYPGPPPSPPPVEYGWEGRGRAELRRRSEYVR